MDKTYSMFGSDQKCVAGRKHERRGCMGDLAIDMRIILKWTWCSVVVQDRYQ
jgi:hypothetical protein